MTRHDSEAGAGLDWLVVPVRTADDQIAHGELKAAPAS